MGPATVTHVVLHAGQRFKPGGQFGVAAFAREFGCGLALVVFLVWIGAMGEEDFCQVAAIGDGSRKHGGESAGLGGVGLGTMIEQETDRLSILTQCEGCVEGLVLLRIAADRVDLRAGRQQGGDGSRRSEGCGKVERRPAVA